ncbi:MAG: hypoxanthine phosphoribosyltransferase [Coriobacteriales bacterium]|nr:hypoxanthine phosphoribosyltransferase [Coriobacteriales bacterium]
MNKDIKEILLSEEDLNNRVAQLGAQITKDYAGNELIVICLLKGGSVFASDLVRNIDLKVDLQFLSASSYGAGHQSSGSVDISADLTRDLTGRHVLICEDLVETGLTLSVIVQYIKEQNPASVEVCVLLDKELEENVYIKPKYVGFKCPEEFIVGYGIDYAHHYRNLPYIAALKEEVYLK